MLLRRILPAIICIMLLCLIWSQRPMTLIINPPPPYEQAPDEPHSATAQETEAAEAYRKAEYEKNDPATRKLWEDFSQTSSVERNYAKAADIARQLVDKDPTRPWILHATYMDFRADAAKLPALIEQIRKAKSTEEIGQVESYMSLFDDAQKKAYLEALHSDNEARPNNLGVLGALAYVARAQNDNAAGIALRKQIAQLAAGDERNLNELGVILIEQENLQELDDVYVRLERAQPPNPFGMSLERLNLAYILKDSAHIKQLRERIDAALRTDFKADAGAGMLYANTLLRYGELADARSEYAAIANNDKADIYPRQRAVIRCLELQPVISPQDRQTLQGIYQHPISTLIRDDAKKLLDKNP